VAYALRVTDFRWARGKPAEAEAQRDLADLVVLDLMLPTAAASISSEAARARPWKPVIVLRARR
jgi:DNA-binding response OmpR family regulator